MAILQPALSSRSLRLILELEPGRRVRLTWLTATGTRGVETVVTVDLAPSGAGTQLRLTHEGFPDAELRDGHEAAWPAALENLDRALSPAE